MLSALALLLGACVGAVFFRVRGGWFGDLWGWPGQASRLAYALAMSAIVVFAGMPWPINSWRLPTLACALPIAWFVGAAAFTSFGAIDGGRNTGPGEGSKFGDFLRNTIRGALYAAPPAALVAVVCGSFGADDRAWASLLMVAGGAMLGIAYELAHRLRPMAEGHPATVYAEFAGGAFLGLGAAASGLF